MPRGIPGSGSGEAAIGGVAKRLFGLVIKATQADLDTIDAEIAEREAELRGIKSLRECLAERVLNSASARNKPAPSVYAMKVGRNIDKARLDVLVWLNHNGPATESGIRKQFNMPDADVAIVMDCKLFAKKFKTWEISADGYAALELGKGEPD